MTAKKAPKAKAKAPAPLTYAKQGDKGWHKLEVVEGDDVRPMAEVLEVSADEGWCRRYMRGPDGKLLTNNGQLIEEFVEGEFVIREAGK
jgi:hypothetical protein